jgi:hypothetical protein
MKRDSWKVFRMTGDNLSPKVYFLAIVSVVGGASLMPLFPVFFTTSGCCFCWYPRICCLFLSWGIGKDGGVFEDYYCTWERSRIIPRGNLCKLACHLSKRGSEAAWVKALL